jgi:hypothetical protein
VRRAIAMVSVIGLALTGCSVARPSFAAPAPPKATSGHTAHGVLLPPGAVAAPGGCGTSELYRNVMPSWATEGGVPVDTPTAISDSGDVMAVFSGYPLRAGDPTDRTNRILWIVRQPRAGSELKIDGRPIGSKVAAVTLRAPADSGPGQVYPSIANVPTPGCWQFDLRWDGKHDVVDVPYAAPGTP